MNAVLVRTEKLHDTIQTFWFQPEKPLHYTAGQFTELYLPHADADNRGSKRWFTLSSSPTEPLLGITTKFAPGRGSTFKQALHALPIGSVVQLSEPMGDFVLPKDKSIPLVFAASGMGITPMRSMIKYLSDRQEQRTIRLLYGVHHQEELLFTELFDAYGLPTTYLVSQPDTTWRGETGRLRIEHLQASIAAQPSALVYLSGPESLIEALAKELKKAGTAEHQLVTDFFPGYTEA